MGIKTNFGSVVVAVPVHNEQDRISELLQSLARQRNLNPFAVVLLLNNCTDKTASIVTEMAPLLPYAIHAVTRRLGQQRANAGTARRLAMQYAARLARPNGVLLSTDADSVLPPDWIAANLAALREGADAVAGRALIDPIDEAALPVQMVQAEERVQLLATLLDQIDCLIDPDPADPWPRHTEEPGASMAVTLPAYHRAGGIPAMKLGEDRAFFAALKREDLRIRHAPDITVTVSGRLHGRAKGGMADTMRRRMLQPDTFLDNNVEHAVTRMVRAYLRRALRQAWLLGLDSRRRLARSLGLPARQLQVAMGSPSFGLAWHQIETTSPVLRRTPVLSDECEDEIARARRIVASLNTGNVKRIRLPFNTASNIESPLQYGNLF